MYMPNVSDFFFYVMCLKQCIMELYIDTSVNGYLMPGKNKCKDTPSSQKNKANHIWIE